MNEPHGIIIRDAYSGYTPPFDVVRTVDRLLCGLPRNRLAGLKTVVVSKSDNLPKQVRNAKRHAQGHSYLVGTCGGRYHPKQESEPAWIELFADNLLRDFPRFLRHFSFFRDFAVSNTLFHEIGHHIHFTQAPEHKEKERVAKDWKRKLDQCYYHQQYWYLMPILFALRLVLRPVYWRMEKKANKRSIGFDAADCHR